MRTGTGPSILCLAADPTLRRQVTGWLHEWGYEPVAPAMSELSVVAAAARAARALVMDLDRLPDSVMEQLAMLAEAPDWRQPVLILNGDGSPATPAWLTPHRAVEKPVDPERLRSALDRALESNGTPEALDHPDFRLRAEVGLWQSPRMRALWEVVQQTTGADVTVLVVGETGTGKDLVARAIHQLSGRRARPFVKVNCAAVPRELLESELFGHERGAFTGAHRTRIGTFEAANGGTVFFDEIGDLHPALQAKLLHVLQDGTFSRVGGRTTLKADVRVLAATNKDLERAVAEGRFRDDLYYRLNVIQITVPPLRERAEEIPLLIDYFVRRYAALYNRVGFRPSPVALERLLRHRYPGNVRELENIVKRMIVLNDPEMVRTSFVSATADVAAETRPGVVVPEELSLKDIARHAARAAEREAIGRVLKQTNWNRVRAAKILRISYRALLYKIKDAGLSRVASVPRPIG
jgi:two-component system response regulator AtoC